MMKQTTLLLQKVDDVGAKIEKLNLYYKSNYPKTIQEASVMRSIGKYKTELRKLKTNIRSAEKYYKSFSQEFPIEIGFLNRLITVTNTDYDVIEIKDINEVAKLLLNKIKASKMIKAKLELC